MTDVLAEVRARLREHFDRSASRASRWRRSVTFLGTDPIEVLRFGPDADGTQSLCVAGMLAVPDARPHRDGRRRVERSARRGRGVAAGATPTGLARSIAVVAAAPAVEGLVLAPDALVDLETPMWDGAPFTAMLLGRSEIDDVELPAPNDPVAVLTATPITPTEAAWVRLKGADAMREAWLVDGVDVRDPRRRASSPS